MSRVEMGGEVEENDGILKVVEDQKKGWANCSERGQRRKGVELGGYAVSWVSL